MKKRFLICGAVLLAGTALALAACGKKDGSTDADGNHVQTYSPQTAKQLGRTAYHADTKTLWCSLSGSGIDFSFYGTECAAELIGDSAWSGGSTVAARYAVYINGERKQDDQLLEAKRTLTITNPGSASDACTVQIVKLSESQQSALGIGALTVTTPKDVYKQHSDTLQATAAKAHLIEFIGDSITCGYGVDGEYGKDVFKTANEDASKAYAMRAAEKLNADYSLVCYSGHGILSGYTGTGTLNKTALVPPYYDLAGHSGALIENTRKIQEDKWDFSRQPDLVVINLGTNDASYTGGDTDKMREFAAKYVDFLKEIRAKNPNAAILCTLGTMGTTLCDAVDLAVMDYTKETGDQNIKAMRFEMQNPDADGCGVDWHPSAATHEKSADALSTFIKDWLKW